MDNPNELFPLVDEQGNILGAITRGEAHGGSKKLHPVVHLHLFNSRGGAVSAETPRMEGYPTRQMGHGNRRTHRSGRECGTGTEKGSGRRTGHPGFPT